MPRVVRNFWIAARIDGRSNLACGGPRRKDGGLYLTVYQRNDGCIAAALKIICTACSDGTLRIRVEPLLPFSRMKDGALWIDTRR
jgi:hypothetical protein